MIRVGKYNYKTKEESKTHGYKNVLIHTTGELSPYTMKDENGTIMENYWQFSKIWQTVDDIKQPLSQYQPNVIRWQHAKETHLVNGKPTKEYWNWRRKGFNHDKWVRYPNAYKNHRAAKGTVYGTENDCKIIDYIQARKLVYVTKYKEIAIKTRQFKELKEFLKNGGHLQIVEVDGPTWDKEYPYNLVENGSIEINEKILTELINNPKQAFGHGYTLAACLLDIDLSGESFIDPLVSKEEPNILHIYTDGSCTGNGYANACAGYGAYFKGREEWNISRKLRGKQSNNAAELYAVYAALKRIYFHDDWSQPKICHFYIDNQITLDTLLTTRTCGANWEIIEKLYKARDILTQKGYKIIGIKVKGHSGNPGNDIADGLATAGGKKK